MPIIVVASERPFVLVVRNGVVLRSSRRGDQVSRIKGIHWKRVLGIEGLCCTEVRPVSFPQLHLLTLSRLLSLSAVNSSKSAFCLFVLDAETFFHRYELTGEARRAGRGKSASCSSRWVLSSSLSAGLVQMRGTESPPRRF
jgi:hypothetical protein